MSGSQGDDEHPTRLQESWWKFAASFMRSASNETEIKADKDDEGSIQNVLDGIGVADGHQPSASGQHLPESSTTHSEPQWPLSSQTSSQIRSRPVDYQPLRPSQNLLQSRDTPQSHQLFENTLRPGAISPAAQQYPRQQLSGYNSAVGYNTAEAAPQLFTGSYPLAGYGSDFSLGGNLASNATVPSSQASARYPPHSMSATFVL